MSLPLSAHNDIERRKAQARDDVDSALLRLWWELAKVPDWEKLTRAGPRLRELFGAYACEAFNIEAKEWVALKLPDAELKARLVEIANGVLSSLIPPQFHLSIRYSLSTLEHDPVYRNHLIKIVQSRIEFWGRQQQHPARVKQIIGEYCKSHGTTIAHLARKVGVDQSVIYALQRGQRKCSIEKVNSIAKLLGCASEELLPAELTDSPECKSPHTVQPLKAEPIVKTHSGHNQ